METGNDSNLRYEQEHPTVVAVMLEDNWESYEVFEEDLSNPELAAVIVEYVEKANGYYPLSSESDNAMGDDIGLVLNAEQEQAVQAALAGGLATVEVLTPFGTDATEVWSIQAYTSGGQTPAGERCFTLTAITEEREILLWESTEDDDFADEILVYSDDSGGDILVNFQIEQPVPADGSPLVFDIVIEDGQVQDTEPMAKIQFISTPAMNTEVTLVDDEAQAAFAVTERATIGSLSQTQAVVETALPLPELENMTLDENETLAPIAVYELPTVEDSVNKEVETEEIFIGIDQLEYDSFVDELIPNVEPETEAAPSPTIIDIQKSGVLPTIRTANEYEVVANEDVLLTQEAEIEQVRAIDDDIQQPQVIIDEEKLADHYHEQPQIVIPIMESAVTSLEALPSIRRTKEADETIRYELPVIETEYATVPSDIRHEISNVASDEVEHQTLRTTIDKHIAHQSNTKTEHTNEVSTWEVSGFESTYNFFSASGLATPAEDDIVIPFQTTIRTKRPSQARGTRSRFV